MKIEDLDKYYFINKEIQSLKQQLKDLQNIDIEISITDGLPLGVNTYNPANIINSKKEKIENRIKAKIETLLSEYENLEKWLNKIEESEIRIIIRMRYIEMKRWEDIANYLHTDRTNPRKKLKTYLIKKGVKRNVGNSNKHFYK